MKKRNRGIIAIVCIMALLISSFATYTARTNASQTDAASHDWTQESWVGADGTGTAYLQKFKFYKASGTASIVNIQTSFSTKVGLYITFADADFGSFTLNGDTLAASDYNTQGAGIIFHCDAFTEKYNELIVNNSQGNAKATMYIYYEDGNDTPASTIDTNGGWLWRNANGEFEAGGANEPAYNSEGICAIYAGNWDASYTADITVIQSSNPYSVPVNVTNSTQNEPNLTQVAYKKTGLDASKEYLITLKAGNTVLSERTVSEVTSDQFCVTTGWTLAAGNHVLTLEAEEVHEPPVVENITITPNTSQIADTKKIFASWTNPSGTTKAYAYLESVASGKGPNTGGWDFNAQATQPMVAVDNVIRSNDSTVVIEPGETYTFIVESYNEFNQKTGYGEVEITIPGLTPEERETREYVAKINTLENLALNKTPIVGSTREGVASNICDGNKGSRWQADPNVENTYFAVDLGDEYDIGKVLVCWEASNARAYDIYTAGADGVYGSTPVASVSGLENNKAIDKLTKNIDVSARYVKIVATQLSGNASAYGISPFELAVFEAGEEPSTEAPTEATTEAPHIVFTKAYRQELTSGGQTHYGIWANWEAVPGAAGYKTYIGEVKAGKEAKSANAGWVWSDQNPPAGSTDTWIDHADMTKDNAWLDTDKSYKLIVIANDSEGNEICRGERLLDGKRDYESLNYTSISEVRTTDSDGTKLAAAYAIYDDESSYNMRAEAANWQNKPHTYSDEYAEVTWGDQSKLFNSPDKVTINGVDYTASDLGPINNYAATLVQFHTTAEGGLHIGYNKVRITKDDEFVTVIFRVGGVVAPEGVTATEQAGVPGSIRVDWTPGELTPSGQVFRVYVDGDMKKGNLTGTSAIINNIDAGTHTVKVVGFYLNEESTGPETTVSVSAGVKYSSDIAVEGFQIRSNYPDDATAEEKNNVAYRTMCRAPKAGNTVKAGGKTYTVRDVGTIYAIDTNTKDKEGTNVLDASYTLLNETPITGQQYTYTGLRQYGGNNVTYGYVAGDEAIISDYKAGDRDNTYYAFTMRNMNAQMANTLWVRPFVVATDGTIIYGKSTAYTSVAEIANVLYTNSMSKNVTSHDYLYNKILHNSILQQAQNPFYRNTQIQYGWNANLYIGFRLVPDSWNGGQADEGQYVVVGDWKIHNSSHYNEEEEGKQAQASYKGNTNDEMQVRVDNPGDEFETDGWFWNWGIQMKLANQKAYNRLQDGRKYRMTITYNTTKPGIMRIKTEGNGAAKQSEGYLMEGHDLVYDFDSQTGGNSHSIEFTYSKQKYINNPGADPSIVICPGAFNVYPFTNATSERLSRSQLHIKYLGQYSDSTAITEGVGGFPAGTIISDVDITFTEIDDFAPDSPNVLH